MLLHILNFQFSGRAAADVLQHPPTQPVGRCQVQPIATAVVVRWAACLVRGHVQE
jgi:hypothetical protein